MKTLPTRPALALLWTLLLLFSLRVAGQALQTWAPQPFLPPAAAFQGSRLPYAWLLASQLVILAVMLRAAWQTQNGRWVASRRAVRVIGWAGAVYLCAAFGRLAVGWAVPTAPAWFSTWIPAAFHVVLAGFVLTLAGCQRQLRSARDSA